MDSVQNGRRRNNSAAALDVMSGVGGSGGANSPAAGGRNLGQPQLSQPLPSPGGPQSSRTEYGSSYFREGISSPKDHVLTKSAADRVRRTSDNHSPSQPSNLKASQQAPSSPVPNMSAGLHKGLQIRSHGSASGISPLSSTPSASKGRGLGDRHSDSPRSPAPGAGGSQMFGVPSSRSSPGPGPADAAAMLRAAGVGSSAGGRMHTFDSRGVAAALSSSMPPAVTYSGSGRGPAITHSGSGRMRTPGGGLVGVEQEANLVDVVAGYGSSSIQGLRDYQEDCLGFLQVGDSLAGGVFDGHGGDQVSKELERVLLQNLMRATGDLIARDQSCMGPSPAHMQAAIARAFVQTNNDITARVPAASEAGSCAVAFLIARCSGVLHLFCANAGDCRAVLFTGVNGSKRAVRLSEDHKPLPQVCPAEIARVGAAGGCVLWGRVQGCLAVSRAFGDKSLAPYVIADPFVSARPLNVDQDLFFYLASDGVTDMVDDATGCQVVAEALSRGQSTAQAAQALVNAAFHKGSSDNISALVVRLRRR